MTSHSKKSDQHAGHHNPNKADKAAAKAAAREQKAQGGGVQGEGDYRAAERYDQSARDFARSGKVDDAARRAAPANAAEGRDLRDAEARGLSHSKGEDPALPHATRGGQPEQR